MSRRITPKAVAEELRSILTIMETGKISRQSLADRFCKIGSFLHAPDDAPNPDEPNKVEVAYRAIQNLLNKELETLKKSGWWVPSKNYVINWALMGFNTWVFTIFPYYPKQTSYRQAKGKFPEGIVISPHWVPTGKSDPITGGEEVDDTNLAVLKLLIEYAQKRPNVKDTVKDELNWAESFFKIKIPDSVVNQLVSGADKVAKRRWGVHKSPNVLIPLDGSKPIQLGAFD